MINNYNNYKYLLRKIPLYRQVTFEISGGGGASGALSSLGTAGSSKSKSCKVKIKAKRLSYCWFSIKSNLCTPLCKCV